MYCYIFIGFIENRVKHGGCCVHNVCKGKGNSCKKRTARIKLESTFADFCQEFVGLNKLENEVSGDRETIERTHFPISLEETCMHLTNH